MADAETKDDTAPEAVAVSAKAMLAATQKLNGENYPTWNIALRQILQSEGLSFVFDDELEAPDDEAKIARASLINEPNRGHQGPQSTNPARKSH